MTTPDKLIVLMNSSLVGVVSRAKDRYQFSYDDAWRASSEPTPLSLSMPIQLEQHADSVVRPFIWGLLPDSEAVLDRWGREFHVSPRNPFALLANVGEECAGAAQFVREERVDQLANERMEWLGESQIADALRQMKRDPTNWHLVGGGQFSLAGAQAKTALYKERDRWGRPAGRLPTTHIIKPSVVGLEDHDLNEHVCLETARQLGLPAASSEIQTFDGERAIVVERFDRTRNGDQLLRVHQEDLCQALAVSPLRKYQADGGPGPTDIVELFRANQTPVVAESSTRRFVDALIYNWIIAGTDAHAKNYSLLLAGDESRLAPLYDVASALAYTDLDRHRLRLAMKIGHAYQLDDVTARSWRLLAQEVGIDQDYVLERISDLASRIPDAMSSERARLARSGLESDVLNRLLEATAERAGKCLRAVH